jgi:2-dehydropantoate 2-reductase
VASPAGAAAITSEGLTLRHGSETIREWPRAVDRLNTPVDLLLVTVKAPQLESALDRIAAEAAAVVPLLNGLEHVDVIRARGIGPVIAGSIGRLEAYRENPTIVVQATAAPLVSVASKDGVAELIRAAGLEVRVGSSERSVLWEKLVRLAPLAAATVVTQRSLGGLRDDPEWRARLEDAVLEACAVSAADGVPLTPAAQWEILDSMPATVTTSAARDAAAGRQTELDAILGAVVRSARRLGIATPTLDGLLADAEAVCQAQSR